MNRLLESKQPIADAANPIVMGILNCTPDSFYEGSRKQTEQEIASRAVQIMQEGGGIIDIGAFSTRPGAQQVTEEEEMKRMRNALTIVRRELPEAVLSIDTFRPAVATMAVEEYGAQIINDVSEGGITGIVDTPLNDIYTDDDMPAIFRTVAQLRAAYILMSVQPTMEAMISNFRHETAMLRQLGVRDIILDPGFGFGKDVIDGNFRILQHMDELRSAFPDMPLLAGVSRKRMIWQLLGCTAQDAAAMQGTMLVNMLALQRGAAILRVHDVKEAADTITIWKKTRECF